MHLFVILNEVKDTLGQSRGLQRYSAGFTTFRMTYGFNDGDGIFRSRALVLLATRYSMLATHTL
jgi:hypothetical protein